MTHFLIQIVAPYFDEITGNATPWLLHLEPWLDGQPMLKAPTRVRYKAEVVDFGKAHKGLTVESLTFDLAQAWARARMIAHKDEASTLKRRLAALRSYWAFLVVIKAADRLTQPFTALVLPARQKEARATRAEFSPAQVVALHAAALAQGDQDMADLILMGAFTGGRIEELCKLTTKDWDTAQGTVRLDSKTDAGRRDVPVLPALETLLTRLASKSPVGGTLLPKKTTKADRRLSQPYSEAFSILKTSQGHDEALVFHSLRKTVATRLKNAGCPETIAADVLGHKVKTMSYGVYAGGSDLDVRRTWMAQALVYPWG